MFLATLTDHIQTGNQEEWEHKEKENQNKPNGEDRRENKYWKRKVLLGTKWALRSFPLGIKKPLKGSFQRLHRQKHTKHKPLFIEQTCELFQ